MNAKTVLQGNDYRAKGGTEDEDQYNTLKSYFYLDNSDLNVIIYYCGPHNESPAIELSYVCYHSPSKLPNTIVFEDNSCDMATVLDGILGIFEINTVEFNGNDANCDDDIVNFAASRCLNYIAENYYSIP